MVSCAVAWALVAAVAEGFPPPASLLFPADGDDSAASSSSSSSSGTKLRRRATEVVDLVDLSKSDKTPLFKGLPLNFDWGVAVAAYQIEGGATAGGRGPSIWDTFSHEANKTFHGETGDVACDFYHKYQHDISLLQALGIRHFRFSLSWSRLLPEGRGSLNNRGVEFYTEVLEALKKAGIEPLVTLYHWDIPQALEDEYGGWRDRRVIKDFASFADACFEIFAPYVNTWLTFNEALTFIGEGYGDGVHAPGRCSDRARCKHGNSNKEPILVAHNVLLSHAAAAARFRDRFATFPEKRLGMTNCGWMAWPLNPKDDADVTAAQNFMEASWGCCPIVGRQKNPGDEASRSTLPPAAPDLQTTRFFDPVIHGDYPQSIKDRVGDEHMPKFTDEERASLKNSIDYLGVNYYTSRWVAKPDVLHPPTPSGMMGVPYLNDEFHATVIDDRGVPIGPRAGPGWLFVTPKGLGDLLRWLNTRYPRNSNGDRFDMQITENGMAQLDEVDATPSGALNDTGRISYMQAHIHEVALAYQDGVDVSAYYAWSFMDNYEWADGYSKRFGLVYVNYTTLKRTPKASAKWYSSVVMSHPGAMQLEKPGNSNRLALALGGAVLALLGVAAFYRRYFGIDQRSNGLPTPLSDSELRPALSD